MDVTETAPLTEEASPPPEDPLLLDRIPDRYTKGWWRVTCHETIRHLLVNLNCRGIRERNLQKQFHKQLADSKELLKFMPNDDGEFVETQGKFLF